jgi:hypothetical protein
MGKVGSGDILNHMSSQFSVKREVLAAFDWCLGESDRFSLVLWDIVLAFILKSVVFTIGHQCWEPGIFCHDPPAFVGLLVFSVFWISGHVNTPGPMCTGHDDPWYVDLSSTEPLSKMLVWVTLGAKSDAVILTVLEASARLFQGEHLWCPYICLLSSKWTL